MPRPSGPGPGTLAPMRRSLLDWYHRNKRDLPWRQTGDPYAIWISEVMLQQTRVAVVIDRFTTFLQRFPTIPSLAAAPEQDVLALWSGLGYYRRARMLHQAAQAIVCDHAGTMPSTAEGLRDLPGIGSYTAAAIASIAHNQPIAVIDGNVQRVLSRIQGWHSDDRISEAAVRRKVEEFAQTLVDPQHPGDFNQAIMELGATVCTPRNPQCLVCPWASECRTLGEHITPKRAPMTTRAAACLLAVRTRSNRTEVLLEQRAVSNSVMPGMWEFPPLPPDYKPTAAPILTVRHAIMQVNYIVHVHAISLQKLPKADVATHRRWIEIEQAFSMALTGLARKVLTKARVLPKSDSRPRVFAPHPIVEVL